MQHVAKISCRNGVEIEYREKKGYNRRENCNMLQKSLVAVAKKRNNSLEKVVVGDKKSLEKV